MHTRSNYLFLHETFNILMFILNAYIWQNTIDTRQHTLKKSIDVFKLSAGENSGINTKDV